MGYATDLDERLFVRETRSRSDRIAGLVLTEWVHARGSSMPRHSHDLGCIALTLDGCMVETYDTARVERMQGTVLYRPPGEPHACATDAGGARCFVVEFDGSILPTYGRALHRLSYPLVRHGGPLTRLAMRVYREWQRKEDAHELMVQALTHEMIASLIRGDGAMPRRAAPPDWLRRVKEALDDSYGNEPTLADLADIGGVHPMHLARAFRQHYQASVGEYLRRRRITVASDQLLKTSRTLTEIALAAGFSSHAHFCTVFKRATGLTPSEFRRLRD